MEKAEQYIQSEDINNEDMNELGTMFLEEWSINEL